MVERIAELVQREEDRGHFRSARRDATATAIASSIELKRDAMPDVVLNQLYKFTPLQTSFAANMLALDGGQPQTMNLKDLLTVFVAFREQVVTRRIKFLLNKARDRAHILVGLAIAVANIDEIIRVIRTSPDPNTARDTLMSRDWPARDVEAMMTLIDDPRHRINADGTARLSLEQAKAILDLRLQRLTALGRDEIKRRARQARAGDRRLSRHPALARPRPEHRQDRACRVKAEFATPRRTVIIEQEGEVEDEDLIQREDMVVTVSHAGYAKRVPLSAYRAQRRGGKGRAGMQTREEDFVSRLFVASTHTPVLFFSSRGQVYKEKVWRLPVAAPNARGKALINILPLEQGERITTIMPLPEDESSWAQSRRDVRHHRRQGPPQQAVGFRRRPPLRHHRHEARGGRGDRRRADLHRARRRAADRRRRPVHPLPRVTDVRVFTGRTSMGVRGIALGKDDKVISLAILRHMEVDAEERAAYLRRANAVRRGGAEEEAAAPTARRRPAPSSSASSAMSRCRRPSSSC